MKNYLQKIDELQNKLKSLLPIQSEDQRRLDKKFRLEFNYNSNHIEGNTLTYGETELLLFFDNTKGDHTLREFEEMKAHDIAYLKISEWAKEERPISETDIKELNRIILVRNFWKEAITPDNQPTRREIKVGNYKEFPNSVRLENGELFDYASPSETPIKMQEMMDWYRNEGNDFHPVDLASMLHYKFVRIHPFDDGNGRVARLLLNYVLLKNNFPPIIIKSSDKKNYLSTLHKADVGDLEAFSKYIAEQLIWSLEISIKAAKGESIDESNDWEKKLAMMKIDVFKDMNKYVIYKKSKESIKDFILENFYELLRKISFLNLKFEALFNSTNYYIYEKGNSSGNFSDLDSIINNVKNDSLIFMDNFIFYINYNNFIKKESISIKSMDIKIIFNENNYSLYLDDNKILIKLYDTSFLDEELDSIVNIIGENLMKQIEDISNQ